jgi:sugar lactone lactonase YvrE
LVNACRIDVKYVEPDFLRSNKIINSGLGHADGIGTLARFNLHLRAIILMRNESVLLVSDYLNNAIRKIDLRNNTYVSTCFRNVTFPNGLAIDKNESYLYVSSAARVIYRFSLTVQFPIQVSDALIIAGSKTATKVLITV